MTNIVLICNSLLELYGETQQNYWDQLFLLVLNLQKIFPLALVDDKLMLVLLKN